MKNGVVVLDGQITLAGGQLVRVEALAPAPVDAERVERVRQLQRLFTEWTDEDGRLTEEEADRLHTALHQGRGLGFRAPALD